MAAQPWCSIVIASYNYASYVGRAIESALQSCGPSREVIVVDDGSTDDTPAALRAYAGQIIALRQTNQGVSAARNRGIAAATGQYVVCLDADDRLLDRALETLAKAAEMAPHAGIVFGGSQSVDVAGRATRAAPPPVMTTRLENFRRYVSGEFSIGIGRSAIRRDVLQRLSFPVGITHGEDLAVYGQTLALYDAVSLPDYVAESFEHADRARNNFSAFLKNGPATISALFREELLPAEALAYRPLFAARWYEELARAAFKMGETGLARRYYHQAFGEHWTSWLRGRHVSRYLRTYLSPRAA